MLLQHVPVDAVGILWEQWIEQQRERISAEELAKRLAASGPSALAQSLRLRETKLSPVSPVQAALPIQDVVGA